VVALRAADALFIMLRGFVFGAERQTTCAAEFVVAALEPMANGNAFIEDEALTVPQARFRFYGLQVLEDAAFKMVDVFKALRAQIRRRLFAPYASGAKHRN